jgi:hypothetical protein
VVADKAIRHILMVVKVRVLLVVFVLSGLEILDNSHLLIAVHHKEINNVCKIR